MSKVTITLPNNLFTELMTMVKAKNKTKAVIIAIKEEIRLRKLEKIMVMAGEMEFTASADELRHHDDRIG